METDPAWSPDGKRIAFASKLDGDDGDTYELWVVNASGFGLRQLTKNDRSDRYPAFSPDGATIAHTYGRNNLPRQEIWRLQVDDTANRTKVTDGEGLVFLHTRPAFSPDGLNIVYVRDSALHVVAAAGGPSVPLTQATPNILDSNPDWQALGFVLPPEPQPPAGDPGSGQPGGETAGQPGAGASGQAGGGQPGSPGTGTPNAKGCTIVGTPGDDLLVGTKGADVICGLAGDDVIRGKGGNDVIKAGPGDDRLLGGGGQDLLKAGAGDDELRGGSGADRLFGQAGDDTFFARKGGRDLLKGGPGRDDAVFDTARDLLRSVEAAL
jgi:Ca2+-binding RTX toxin-like protein